MIWGILACCFVFLGGQLSHAATCNAITGGGGINAPDNNTVLMLATTLADSAGTAGNLCTSLEAVQAQASPLNLNVEIDDAAAWGAKSQAQFATYRGIVLGDPNCAVSTASITGAESTTETWGPAITGPVAIVGTDPEFHSINNGDTPTGSYGHQLTQNAIALATSTAGEPGAYISLSCYYANSPANTPVPVLAPFGSFNGSRCRPGNNSNIVPPANPLATTPNRLTEFWPLELERINTRSFQ